MAFWLIPSCQEPSSATRSVASRRPPLAARPGRPMGEATTPAGRSTGANSGRADRSSTAPMGRLPDRPRRRAAGGPVGLARPRSGRRRGTAVAGRAHRDRDHGHPRPDPVRRDRHDRRARSSSGWSSAALLSVGVGAIGCPGGGAARRARQRAAGYWPSPAQVSITVRLRHVERRDGPRSELVAVGDRPRRVTRWSSMQAPAPCPSGRAQTGIFDIGEQPVRLARSSCRRIPSWTPRSSLNACDARLRFAGTRLSEPVAHGERRHGQARPLGDRGRWASTRP